MPDVGKVNSLTEKELAEIAKLYLETHWNPCLIIFREKVLKGRLRPDMMGIARSIFNVFQKDIDKKYLIPFILDNKKKFDLLGFEIENKYDETHIIDQIGRYLDAKMFSRLFLIIPLSIEPQVRELLINHFQEGVLGLITIDVHHRTIAVPFNAKKMPISD